jgi:hypothetical protein
VKFFIVKKKSPPRLEIIVATHKHFPMAAQQHTYYLPVGKFASGELRALPTDFVHAAVVLGEDFTVLAPGLFVSEQLAVCFLEECGISFIAGVTTAVRVVVKSEAPLTADGVHLHMPLPAGTVVHVVAEVPVDEAAAALKACTKLVFPDGTKKRYQLGTGVVHCDSFYKPAITYADGSKAWMQLGTYFRARNAYTFETANGTKMWLDKAGVLQSVDDDPAVFTARGSRRWYHEGKLHRDQGPAEITTCGTMRWLRHGQLHRVGMPAVVHSTGDLYFFEDGELHREGGLPAVEYHTMETEYWIKGKRINVDGSPWVGEAKPNPFFAAIVNGLDLAVL